MHIYDPASYLSDFAMYKCTHCTLLLMLYICMRRHIKLLLHKRFCLELQFHDLDLQTLLSSLFRCALSSPVPDDADAAASTAGDSQRVSQQDVTSTAGGDARSVRSFSTEEWSAWRERFRRETLRYKSVR